MSEVEAAAGAQRFIDVVCLLLKADISAEGDRIDLEAKIDAYLRCTAFGRLQTSLVDLALVVPPFVREDLSARYLEIAQALNAERASAGQALARQGSLASDEQALAQAVHDLEAMWLRETHFELSLIDFLNLPIDGELGSSAFDPGGFRLGDCPLPGAAEGRLWSLAASFERTLDLRPENDFDPQVVTDGSDVLRSMLGRATAGELLARLPEILLRLDGEIVESADELAASERRHHQLVLLTAQVSEHLFALAGGGTFNLMLELDDPPPVSDRSLERFPAVRARCLEALTHTDPRSFAAIRSEKDLDSASTQRRWREITLGVVAAGFARELGVVGVLAEAARPVLARLRESSGEQAS